MELTTVRSSRPFALIVTGSCAEVRDHVPELKYGDSSEISLVVFDPPTTKYEERGVRQRVTYVQVGSQSVNRRRESVDAQMPDGQTIECTIDVLEDFASVGIVGSFLAESTQSRNDVPDQTGSRTADPGQLWQASTVES